MDSMMRAVVAHHYGSEDVLRVERVPRPLLGDADVRIAVEASAVTRGDVRMRAARFGGLFAIPGRLLFGVFRPRHRVPGTSYAGRVVETGPGVTTLAVGQRVIGLAMHGAHAEEVVVRSDGAVAPRPDEMDAALAASVAYGAATAWSFLAQFASVRAGDRVVVVGVGGVGRAAIEVARSLGAEVSAVCGVDHMPLARALGADRVVERGEGAAAFGVGTVDVVFDTTGRARVYDWRRALRPGGRFAATDTTVARLLAWCAGKCGWGPRVVLGVAPDRRDVLEQVVGLVVSGAVRPRVAAERSLEDVAAAHVHVERGRPVGEVVLRIASSAAASPAAAGSR
jgi:NADPH:quinone reductase-like Zn-dependent oxidoreductase